jgi:thioredoxin 1
MALNISESTFTNFIENSISLLYIRADWCNPCKQLSPIIDEVSAETAGKVLVGKMDADQNMDLCKEYNVRNIPTILLFKNGELVDRTTGLKSKQDILEMIEKHS